MSLEIEQLDPSIDIMIIDIDGNSVPWRELITDPKEQAKFIRLKIDLLAIATNELETRVIHLLSEQYDIDEIASELNLTIRHTRRLIKSVGDRYSKCLGLKLKLSQNRKKKKSQ